MKNKKRPKQNFNIDYLTIRNSDLKEKTTTILLTALEFHKANCKYEYKNFLNQDLMLKTGFAKNTLYKYRQNLVDNKFIEMRKVRNGKSFLLEYRFNWAKLAKLGFISPIVPIEQNEFKPVFKKKVNKPVFLKGDVLTIEDKAKFIDTSLYDVRKYRLNKEGVRQGSGKSTKHYGNVIKKLLNINNSLGENEYVFQSMEVA